MSHAEASVPYEISSLLRMPWSMIASASRTTTASSSGRLVPVDIFDLLLGQWRQRDVLFGLDGGTLEHLAHPVLGLDRDLPRLDVDGDREAAVVRGPFDHDRLVVRTAQDLDGL